MSREMWRFLPQSHNVWSLGDEIMETKRGNSPSHHLAAVITPVIR